MPRTRMPYPHCDQSCQNKPVSNASDNIKLKILEDKLRNDLVQKDLTDLPEVSEVKSSDYLYIYDSEQEQVKKISANEILNQVDLDDYAKKEDLHNYAEKEHTHEEYLTEHQSLENYYTKEETDLKVSSEIEQAKNEVKEEIEAKGYLTEHQDLTEYAKKEELFSKDYSDLTNKPEIPSVEGLASEDFVRQAISEVELKEGPAGPQGEKGDQGEPGKDGLTTAIKVGETTYIHENGVISLPQYITEHQSLDNYATKTYVTEEITKAVTDGKVDLTGYATENFVNEAIDKIEFPKPDLTGYAKLTDIPDVSNFIEEIPEEYITETELEAKKYLTEHQSLEDYAKKNELFSKNYNDLINKPEIPSIEGLATETFVKEEIKNSGHLTIADLQIGEDFITDIKVGYLDTGFEVKATMTFGDLLKRILHCEHEWIDATCTTPKTCRLCGKTEGEALGHIEEIIEGKAADCTNTGLTDGVKCTRCGEILVSQQTIPALGHDYGEWVITKQPEVGVEGQQQKTCKRCGDVVTEEIPALSEPEIPSIPGIPEDSAVGNIIANSVPAYSGTASSGEEEVAFEILDTATAAPTDQGLYVTYNENNEAIATGYQLTMEGNTNMDAQTFALPVEATIKRAWQYDEMGKTWLEYDFPGDYWRPGDIVTKTIDGVTYEYQSYSYNVDDIGDAISNDEYWRFEMEVNN